MICPKCGLQQPESPECTGCGIIIEKYLARQRTTAAPPTRRGKSTRYRTLEKERELQGFYESYGMMLRSGLNASDASSRVLKDSVARNRGPYQRLLSAVENGQSIADGMAQSPDYFPPHHVDLVSAGERAGDPEAMLKELERATTMQIQTREKVTKELRKPVLTALASFFILPVPTLVSDGLMAYLGSSVLPLGIVFAIGFGGRAVWKAQYANAHSALRMDERLFDVGLVRHFLVDRFVQVFQLLYAAGVTPRDAFVTAANATGNRFLTKVLVSHQDLLAGGQTLSETMRATGAFPSDLLQVLSAGEAAGSIPDALSRYHATSTEKFEISLGRTMSTVSLVVGLLLMGYVGVRIVFGFMDAMPQVDIPV